MSIATTPGGTFEYPFYGAPTGLVGTMRYRIEDGQGHVIPGFDWSIAGFVESPAGSGSYTLTAIGPQERATYTLVVNNGSTPTPTNTITEELRVGGPDLLGSAVAGTYTTVEAVRQVLAPDGSQSATLGTAASLSDAEIEEAIAEGATEIDARLAARYTVPFPAPVPPILEKLNRDLAAFLATLVYRRNTPLPPEDPIRLRYSRALDILRQIGKGEIELTTTTGEVSETGEPLVINPYDGDLFTLADLNLGIAPYRAGIMPGVPMDPYGFDN